MAARKIQPIDDCAMNQYAIGNYSERVYSKVYYAIREVYGLVAKRSMGDDFNWNEFKTRFTETFGEVTEKRYTLEQLLYYSKQKFGKSLEDLLDLNQRSWQRREEYAKRLSQPRTETPEPHF